MGENAVIIKSPVGCPAAKTNGYPGVERRLDLIHREDLTYRLDRNVFIPCNTGVIVRDAVCDDDTYLLPASCRWSPCTGRVSGIASFRKPGQATVH